MGLATEAGEVDTDAIVLAFDGEGVGLALQMAMPGEDQTLGRPEVEPGRQFMTEVQAS